MSINLKQWSLLTIQCEPDIEDPREFQTILTSSLKSLWGDLEPHSCSLQVYKKNKNKQLIVRCLKESVDQVRAALTLVTPPPYLDSNIYRFDVVEVKIDENA